MQAISMRYSFGPFTLCPVTRQLFKSGYVVKLEPQPFQVLVVLVQRRGELITRDDLRSVVWPEGTNVEFDPGLNYCIRKIRVALGDDARAPAYVETVPKHGYRFLAEVAILESSVEARSAPAALNAATSGSDSGQRNQPRKNRWWILAPALVLAIAVAVAARTNTHPELPRDPQARQLFIEARHLTDTWERDKVEQAVASFAQITRIEPDFAPAWAEWANADIVLAYQGSPVEQELADAEAHARKAVALDGRLSLAHAALGHSYWQQWKWQQAEAEFQQALVSGGNTAVAHQLYGLYLASIGRGAEAIRHAQAAVEMDPLSGLFNFSLSQVYLEAGQFDSAAIQAEKTLHLDRHFPLAFQTLFRANLQLQRYEDAEKALNEEHRLFPTHDLRGWRSFLLSLRGRTAEARATLNSGVPSKNPAVEPLTSTNPSYASLGGLAGLVALHDYDAALQGLTSIIERHTPSAVWLWTDPELQSLQSDYRFREIADRVRRVP